jgi:hypothetical protein
MNGYCGDCDEQIEFVERNIRKDKLNNTVYIYLICPYCEDEELITEVNTD